MRNVSLYFFISFTLWAMQVNAQKASVAKGDVPAWVKPVTVQYNLARLESKAEDGYLDVAFIKQVNLPQQVVYTRQVYKVISKDGLDNIPEVSVAYNPAYEKLTFHDVHIIRNGQSIDRLKKAKFTTSRYEEEAYMYPYNGNVTALLSLDDLQVGDVVDYAYSINGFNPLFEGRYAENYSAAFTVPVGKIYYRLVTDAARPVYVESYNTDASPIEVRNGSLKEYEWSFDQVAAIVTEDNLPSWYDPYPLIMVSEYNDWLNIRDWAARLFPNKPTINGPLQKKIDAIKNMNAANDARAAAALRFVQDDIRYLDVDMWSGAHKPSNPGAVLAWGYGDSKDKCYLLVTMLNAMGIEATPVLVNSTLKQSIAKYLPSPGVFNNFTVRITIDEQEYYVDPSLTSQRGSLADISYPDYQRGLVLADSTSGLTTITNKEPGMAKVREVFSLPNKQGQATLIVSTINTGTYADNARSAFNNSTAVELQKTYKQFYETYFPKIKADSIYYEDDERTGAFTVYEQYTIDDLWPVEKGIMKANFYGFVINGYLTRPKNYSRTMPMALYYPARYSEEIQVELPEDWALNNFDKEVICDYFRYKGNSTLTGRSLNLVFEFETIRDYVGPGEMKDLMANYKKIDGSMGWELTYNTKAKRSSSFSATSAHSPLSPEKMRKIKMRLAIFFAVLTGLIIFAVVRQKRRRVQ